ncbi:kinase-like domain-containing protein [Baffinella frigidus]|nr:kinase-like domain-containing protein [Cryptophyta sp. CCMP2293]
MEFMDAGSLLDVLRLGDHRIPINVLKGVAKQVLDALVYLHSVKRVIHRDVKPGNILMNRKGEVKLADFGVTYMSPERITGDQYSFNADVWAVGVLIVEAALGRYPYLLEGMDKARMEFWDLLEVAGPTMDLLAVVLHTNVSQMLPGEVDANFRSFAEYLLQNDHSLRPSASEALHHPFLAGVNAIPKRCTTRSSRAST